MSDRPMTFPEKVASDPATYRDNIRDGGVRRGYERILLSSGLWWRDRPDEPLPWNLARIAILSGHGNVAVRARDDEWNDRRASGPARHDPEGTLTTGG